jgi:hypothetical protein
MNVPSARESRASVARQYRSAAFAVIFDPDAPEAVFIPLFLPFWAIALFILHWSKLTHPEKQSYPLTRIKAGSAAAYNFSS